MKPEYDISDINLDGLNERCDTRQNSKRHSAEKVAQVKWLLEKRMSVIAISDHLQIPTSTITQIRRNETHCNVEPIFPIDLITESDLDVVKSRIKALEKIIDNKPKTATKRPVIKGNKNAS